MRRAHEELDIGVRRFGKDDRLKGMLRTATSS
jgi:hypothetical protein